MATKSKEIGKVVEMATQERRGSVRYPFTAAADVLDLESDALLSARSSDLARGGCFIDTISTFPIGANVSLRLTYEEQTFQARARVVYETPGVGMGLAFMPLEPDQLWVLEKWLGKLSGKLPPELHDHHEHQEDAPGMLIEHEPGREMNVNVEPGFVLNELIIALMRKHVLSESEGKQLLQKLLR